ncbi:MAG: DUF2333 family protein [Thiohalocapsa sp.]
MASDTLRNPNPLPEPSVPTPEAAYAAEEEAAQSKATGGPSWVSILLGSVGALALLIGGLGLWASFQPAKFDVTANMREILGDDVATPAPGSATTAAAIRVAETLLDKPVGYLQNDVLPPGILMDNMPSWEYGALTELRDSVRSMRNDFSRSQTQSIENLSLKEADSEFNFDADAWILPAAEEEYRQGARALRDYLAALQQGTDQTARFYTRADNLSAYLGVVEKRLGSYGQRLSASVGDEELTAALTAGIPAAQTLERTGWTQIDNVFFEARGYTWALLHMMKALSVDFADVLEDKNAEVSMQQIIRDLEQASMRKWSPVMLNGHGFGWVANHSLVLASYIARANAGVLDLRMLLQRG